MNIEHFFQPKDKTKQLNIDRKGSTLTFGKAYPETMNNLNNQNKNGEFFDPNEISHESFNLDKLRFPLIQHDNTYSFDPSLVPQNASEEQKAFYTMNPSDINDVQSYKEKLTKYFLKLKEKNKKSDLKMVKLIYIHNSSFPNKTIPDKVSNKINPKCPFVKDDYIIDYDKDSEEEFMEENAEDLQSNENSVEEEDEEDDDNQNEKWIVPDGHLSEDELSEKDAIADRQLFEKSKNKMGGIMEIMEIRKNFTKPIIVNFNNLNLSNATNSKERNLSMKLSMTIFHHYGPLEEHGDILQENEGNNDISFPIKIQRKKTKATGIKNSILDHLEDIIKQIHGSFQTKEQMIILLNEKFADIPKKTLDTFFKDKCLKVKHNINQKKYWLVKHETLDELNLSSVEVNKILEDNYKLFEEKEKKRLQELEVNKQKNLVEKPKENTSEDKKDEHSQEQPQKEQKIKKKRKNKEGEVEKVNNSDDKEDKNNPKEKVIETKDKEKKMRKKIAKIMKPDKKDDKEEKSSNNKEIMKKKKKKAKIEQDKKPIENLLAMFQK